MVGGAYGVIGLVVTPPAQTQVCCIDETELVPIPSLLVMGWAVQEMTLKSLILVSGNQTLQLSG